MIIAIVRRGTIIVEFGTDSFTVARVLSGLSSDFND